MKQRKVHGIEPPPTWSAFPCSHPGFLCPQIARKCRISFRLGSTSSPGGRTTGTSEALRQGQDRLLVPEAKFRNENEIFHLIYYCSHFEFEDLRESVAFSMNTKRARTPPGVPMQLLSKELWGRSRSHHLHAPCQLENIASYQVVFSYRTGSESPRGIYYARV